MAAAREALFIIDPLEQLSPAADTSLVMMHEGLRRGHQVYVATLSDLGIETGGPFAHAQQVVTALEGWVQKEGEPMRRPLADFDVVFMRKDPPFDDDYLSATWILEAARGQCMLVNDPAGLRELNEKLAILAFPELIPATRLLRRRVDLDRALADFGGKMIVKPVFGFGGREILQAREGDPNLGSIYELATRESTRWTVAQAFIESAHEGDKRILLVDGEPIGAVMRVPARGELRNNFHAGGHPEATELDERDHEICARVGPHLRERGQFFAGLDVIGGLLTEINVTSPTGMQEINALGGLTGEDTMQARFWTGVERRLGAT